MDTAVGELVRDRLAGGGTVVVLAQGPEAAGSDPVAVEMAEVATAWAVGTTGRLVTCQYRLAEPAGWGDPAALAILGDLLGWAAGGAG